MKISQLDDESRRDYLDRAYQAACDAHEAGELEGGHPSRQVISWAKLGQARDEGGLGPERIQGARSNRGSGLGPVEIQNKAKDDVQPSESERGNAGAEPAQDGRYSLDSAGVPRFETTGGQVIVGDAAIEANARQSSPARVQRMSANLAGYSRLK